MQFMKAILAGLLAAGVAVSGCVPRGNFEIAIGAQPTTTLAPAATSTVAYTPTMRPTDTETLTPSPTPESFPID